MYRRILIPLDGSKESEGVVDLIRGELAPDGEVVLLQVISPAKTQVVGGQVLLGSQREEVERSKAETYLRGVLRELDSQGDPTRRRGEVVVAESVCQGIVDFARKEEVDLIAMYTHDRKGIARLIKGSIASDVSKRAPIEVKVFKPRELASAI